MAGGGITRNHWCILEIQDVLFSLSLFLPLGRPNTKQQQQARSRVLQWERRKQDTWVLSPALQPRALTAPCARGWTEAGRWGQWLIIRLPRRIATTKRFLGYLSTSDLLSQNLQGWCPGNLYISKLSGRFLRSVGTKNHWTP